MQLTPDEIFDQIAEDFGPHIADRFMDEIEKSMVAMQGFEQYLDNVSDERYNQFFYAPINNTSVQVH